MPWHPSMSQYELRREVVAAALTYAVSQEFSDTTHQHWDAQAEYAQEGLDDKIKNYGLSMVVQGMITEAEITEAKARARDEGHI